MKCRKRPFRDKNDAVYALHGIQNKNDDRKKPVRAYQCEHCQQWHLTSEPIDTELNSRYKLTLDWSNLFK